MRESGSASEEESFPELDAFTEEQRRRHRRIVVILLLSGVPMFVFGVYMFIAMEPIFMFVALLLMAMGLFALVRASLSFFTDFDTRERSEWVGVAAPEDIRYEPLEDDEA